MIIKTKKSGLYVHFKKFKKTKRINGRISPELKEQIHALFPTFSEQKIIDIALVNLLFQEGLNLINEDGNKYLRIEAHRPYISKKNYICRNCYYYKNWKINIRKETNN